MRFYWIRSKFCDQNYDSTWKKFMITKARKFRFFRICHVAPIAPFRLSSSWFLLGLSFWSLLCSLFLSSYWLLQFRPVYLAWQEIYQYKLPENDILSFYNRWIYLILVHATPATKMQYICRLKKLFMLSETAPEIKILLWPRTEATCINTRRSMVLLQGPMQTHSAVEMGMSFLSHSKRFSL